MLPPTCYNCGKPIGELESVFENHRNNVPNKQDIGHILDSLGVTKICCRTLFLTFIDEVKLLVNKNEKK